jgi:hypothetical protein
MAKRASLMSLRGFVIRPLNGSCRVVSGPSPAGYPMTPSRRKRSSHLPCLDGSSRPKSEVQPNPSQSQNRSFAPAYSTSSAAAKISGEMVMSSALAVLRLTTISSLVGNSTGKSLGAAPFKILSTKVAAR